MRPLSPLRGLTVAGALIALALRAGAPGPAADPAAAKRPAERRFTAAEVALYEQQVLPILKANCLKCHGGEKTRGGLRLTSRAGVLKGGDSGPAVSLEKPGESRLLQAINYRDGLEMPPTGKLKQTDIDTLTRWVQAGVPFPAGQAEAVKAPEHKGDVVTP